MRIKNEAEENNKKNPGIHKYISSTGMGAYNLPYQDPDFLCWIVGSENIKNKWFTYFGDNSLIFKYYIL